MTSATERVAVAPVISAHKLQFFKRRWLETCLSGIRIRQGDSLVPLKVILLQFVLWIIPLVVSFVYCGSAEPELQSYLLSGTIIAGYVAIVRGLVQYSSVDSLPTVMSITTASILNDEDETDFDRMEELLDFVFEKKSHFTLLLHIIISFLLYSSTSWFLNDARLQTIFQGGFRVASIIGWLTVSLAQFNLTCRSPVEMNVWTKEVNIESIRMAQRAIHVLILIAITVVFQYACELDVFNHGSILLLLFFPLFWSIGLLSEPVVLVEWLIEQEMMILYGTTSFSSCRRTFSCFLTSMLFTVICVVAYKSTSLSVFTALCFALSTILSKGYYDICSLLVEILNLCTKKHRFNLNSSLSWTTPPRSSVVLPTSQLDEPLSSAITDYAPPVVRLLLDLVQAVAFFVVLSLVLGNVDGFDRLLIPRNIPSTFEMNDTKTSLVFVLVTLAAIKLVMLQIRKPYLFGMFRNRIQSLSSVNMKFALMALDAAMQTCGIVLLVGYISRDSSLLGEANYPAVRVGKQIQFGNVVYVVSIIRAGVHLLVSPSKCAIELALAVVLDSHNSEVSLIGISANSVYSTYTVKLIWLHLLFHWAIQLVGSARFMLVHILTTLTDKKQRIEELPAYMQVLLLPWTLANLLLATVLGSPLSPMLGSSVFVVGFPRPQRDWFQLHSFANSTEASYYQQAAPRVTEVLQQLIKDYIVLPSEPLYVLRFEKMLLYIRFVEHGVGYAVFHLAGLELLEQTSCHNVESNVLDEMIDATLVKPQSTEFRSLFKYSMEPVTAVRLPCYSSSSIRLTGIVDSPDFLNLVDKCLLHSLIYKFRGSIQRNGINAQYLTRLPVRPSELATEQFPYSFFRLCVDGSSHSSGPLGPVGPEVEEDFDVDQLLLDIEMPSTKIKPRTQNSALLGSKSNNSEISISPASSPGHLAGKSESLPNLPADSKAAAPGYLSMLLDPSSASASGGLSCERTAPEYTSKLDFGEKEDSFDDLLIGLDDMVAEQRRNKQTSLQTFATPAKAKAASATTSASLDTNVEFLLNLHALVNVVGVLRRDLVAAGASHVLDCFNGNFPDSVELEWLTTKPELQRSVIEAYRLGVKLALDVTTLGVDVDDQQEVMDTLDNYSQNWFIGMQSSQSWSEHILEERQQLVSLMRKDGDLALLTLSVREEECFLVKMDHNIARGLWSSLVFELFYAANNDDERYSIQAHKTLFRNLIVQAANPPLGYPIYGSGLLSIQK